VILKQRKKRETGEVNLQEVELILVERSANCGCYLRSS